MIGGVEWLFSLMLSPVEVSDWVSLLTAAVLGLFPATSDLISGWIESCDVCRDTVNSVMYVNLDTHKFKILFGLEKLARSTPPTLTRASNLTKHTSWTFWVIN